MCGFHAFHEKDSFIDINGYLASNLLKPLTEIAGQPFLKGIKCFEKNFPLFIRDFQILVYGNAITSLNYIWLSRL
jgi:hypothetical protein